MHCNPRKVPSGNENEDEDNRFQQFQVSLHCYVWTAMEPLRAKRADLCCLCAEMKLLSNDALECIGGNRTTVELPTEVKRRIWKYVDWGSWW